MYSGGAKERVIKIYMSYVCNCLRNYNFRASAHVYLYICAPVRESVCVYTFVQEFAQYTITISRAYHQTRMEWNIFNVALNSVGARLRLKQGYHIRMKTRSETGRERLIERETAERATHKYYEKSIQIQE